ncbi:MAG: DUF916 domain-containing protein [Patulibacter sp.]|nr:DUF916 domain-containing protein [Patulibacter sp.]
MDLLARQRAVVRVLVVAAGLALGAAPSAVAAGGGGGFSAAPAKGAPQDKDGTYFALHASRGQTLHETLVVSNLSKNEKHFLVDPVDGLTGATSGTVYADRDDQNHKAGTWVTTTVGSLTVPPHSVVRVPFTVHVPGVARPGDHLAGLAIQDAHRAHSKSRFSVTQIIRVVVGVQITVKGAAHQGLALGKVAMAPLPGTKVPSVTIELASTGERLCKPLLHISVGNAKTGVRVVTHRLDTVLPGTKITFPMPWPTALAAGTYDVKARATHCGPVTSVAATATLGQTLRGTPTTPDPPAPVVIVRAGAATPWWAFVASAGFAALLGGIFAAVLLRRRKKPADAL